MTKLDTDVLIIGAGLSGIGAAVHLQKLSPGKTYRIYEARDAIGGTWDLFRYPGIRSDSDMHTLGFDFKPWTEAKAIADGPSIRKYVNQTADEYGVRKHIQFNTKIIAANWSSADQAWRSTNTSTGPATTVRSRSRPSNTMASTMADASSSARRRLRSMTSALRPAASAAAAPTAIDPSRT